MTLQKFFFLLSRTIGDGKAAQRGTLGKRVVRRQVTRRIARQYDRVWR